MRKKSIKSVINLLVNFLFLVWIIIVAETRIFCRIWVERGWTRSFIRLGDLTHYLTHLTNISVSLNSVSQIRSYRKKGYKIGPAVRGIYCYVVGGRALVGARKVRGKKEIGIWY